MDNLFFQPEIASGVEIILTDDECIEAIRLGSERLLGSYKLGLNHANTRVRDPLERITDDVLGVCGEIAFSRYAGIEWAPTINTFHWMPDVGHVEVRTTLWDNGCLILRDDDQPDRWYYLVTGRPPIMMIRGGIQYRDGIRTEWEWNAHGWRPSWKVPQSALVRKR